MSAHELWGEIAKKCFTKERSVRRELYGDQPGRDDQRREQRSRPPQERRHPARPFFPHPDNQQRETGDHGVTGPLRSAPKPIAAQNTSANPRPPDDRSRRRASVAMARVVIPASMPSVLAT